MMINIIVIYTNCYLSDNCCLLDSVHACVCCGVLRQSEKAGLLMEHEVQKMQELDNQYESELRDWNHNLTHRKQVRETRHRPTQSPARFIGTFLLTI